MITFPLPDNLSIRPARDEDHGFMESLYRSTRDDLRLLAAERDWIEEMIGHQYRAQQMGYGHAYPNAYYFIVERLGEQIGRIVVDIGDAGIHLVDIAFLPKARGQGYGSHILRALQHAAAQVQAPLSLSVNPAQLSVKQLYLSLGFVVIESHPLNEKMVWHHRTA